jgi:2-oxoglutarate ferredoxin oxidoreductase subunit delta
MPIAHHHGARRSTQYITLDHHRCKACGVCLEVCGQGVLRQVKMLFHKHVVIVNPQSCLGCLKCVKACQHEAIQASPKVN